MGVVYKAEDHRARALHRAEGRREPTPPAEARVMAALEHPGILPVHDAGTLPDGRVTMR